MSFTNWFSWLFSTDAVDDAFKRALVIKFLKPDRLIPAVSEFLRLALPGASLNAEVNLQEMVFNEVKASTPIAFCSIPGYDASYRVETFARENGKKFASVALGSAEGFAASEAAITSAARSGGWVLLKNGHLAPQWLGHLEKRLHSLKPESNFRLFLTMETNPAIPTNLLRMSRTLMFEPPPGMKSGITDTLGSIHQPRYSRGPAERARLYFLVAWLHSVLQERLRYSPLGWTKQYEFTDADQDTALACVDYWLDSVAGGRANVSPDKIPWQAIRRLLKETVYGGKIDNEYDQKLLDSFVDHIFVPGAFEIGFKLVKGADVVAPDGAKFSDFEHWTEALPALQPPSWLGLPDSAELVVMANRGAELVRKIRKISSLADDEVVYPTITSPALGGAGDSDKADASSHARTTLPTVEKWIANLPDAIPASSASKDAKDPVQRYFAREVTTANRILNMVRKDLADVAAVCRGTAKLTNHNRSLLDSIAKGGFFLCWAGSESSLEFRRSDTALLLLLFLDSIPSHWQLYKVPKSMSLNAWFSDFVRRCEEVAKLTPNLARLGGQFFPEALITATRQLVAQRNGWSVEELDMEVKLLAGTAAAPADAFVLERESSILARF